MKIQEFGLLAIVVTICVAFLGSVLGSALGKPVAPELQGVINTSFTALVVVVPAWLAIKANAEAKEQSAANAARYEGLRAGVQLGRTEK